MTTDFWNKLQENIEYKKMMYLLAEAPHVGEPDMFETLLKKRIKELNIPETYIKEYERIERCMHYERDLSNKQKCLLQKQQLVDDIEEYRLIERFNKLKNNFRRSRKSVRRSRKSVRRSRKSVPRSRKSVRRSRKSVRRSRKSVRRSRKSVRRSRKSVRRSRKSVRRSRKSVRRSRKSVRRSRKSVRRSRKNI